MEIVHIEALIVHELCSGWFKFGVKNGRQTNGLPMGSQWGGALRRLGFVYCDICFYSSLHCRLPSGDYTIPPTRQLPPVSERGRITRLTILQAEVLILEVRYMDDYLSLWKGPSDLPVDHAKAINDILRDRAYQRYPLPLKRDRSSWVSRSTSTALARYRRSHHFWTCRRMVTYATRH